MMTLRRMNRIISLLLITFSTLFMMLSIIPAINNAKADDNIATWILCGNDDGKKMYNAATTDLVPYSVRSKSAGASTNRVDFFLNGILSASGYDFNKVNKAILGRDVVPSAKKAGATTDTTNKTTGDPNKSAARVNPFDRFGVAGLNWSSYNGEWKYYQVDACKSDDDAVSSTEYGKFYKTRKEPKTTYDGVNNSMDPRTKQFARGTMPAWLSSLNDLLANTIFALAKIVIAFTVALIGLAFSDITSVMGLTNLHGGGSMVSLFQELYTGVYQPLLALMMVITGLYILYKGILQRQVRASLQSLASALLCFFVATVMGTNPTFWVSLPNTISTYGEAIVVSALSKDQKGKGGWCDTDVADITASKISSSSGFAKQQQELEKVGTNMKSVIGCRMWQEYLLRPWSEAQFGTIYSKLDAKDVKNKNNDWVGSPSVPLGGNTVVKNWALFQISVQTNAHSQLGEDGKLTTSPDKNQISTVDGTAVDWFRIVDAMSNYGEKEPTTDAEKGNLGGTDAAGAESANDQITSYKPVSQWQNWIGNHSSERYGTAILAVFFAILGAIGPLVFAFMAAIYGVGVTLLMAVAPIFLLMGSWAGNGTQIFKGWLASLLNTMVKKIVAAGMILLSFNITMSGMDLVDSIGWVKALILTVIMTLVMLKSRGQLMNMFASFNFGSSFSPARGFSQVVNNMRGKAAQGALSMGGIAYGAYKGHQLGLGAMRGIKSSAKTQANLLARRSTIGRSYLYERDQNQAPTHPLFCNKCGTKIKPGSLAYRDEDGNYYCYTCGEEFGQTDDMYLVKIPTMSSNAKARLRKKRAKALRKQGLFNKLPESGAQAVKVFRSGKTDAGPNHDRQALRYGNYYATTDRNRRALSWLSYGTLKQRARITGNDNDGYDWDDANITEMAQQQLRALDADIDNHKEAYAQVGNQVMAAPAPEFLDDYLDKKVVDAAWRNQRYDVVQASYQTAWKNWHEENGKDMTSTSAASIAAFNKAVDEYNKKNGPNDGTNGNGEVNYESIKSMNLNKAQQQEFDKNALKRFGSIKTIKNLDDETLKKETNKYFQAKKANDKGLANKSFEEWVAADHNDGYTVLKDEELDLSDSDKNLYHSISSTTTKIREDQIASEKKRDEMLVAAKKAEAELDRMKKSNMQELNKKEFDKKSQQVKSYYAQSSFSDSAAKRAADEYAKQSVIKQEMEYRGTGGTENDETRANRALRNKLLQESKDKKFNDKYNKKLATAIKNHADPKPAETPKPAKPTKKPEDIKQEIKKNIHRRKDPKNGK